MAAKFNTDADGYMLDQDGEKVLLFGIPIKMTEQLPSKEITLGWYCPKCLAACFGNACLHCAYSVGIN